MAEEKKPASSSERRAAERKTGDAEKRTFTGAGDDTPNPKEAAERQEEVAKRAFQAAAEINPDYDPNAHRDPVRNADDSIGASGARRREMDEDLEEDGVPPEAMTLQISQFDESTGDTLRHLAHPSKNAIRARDLSRPGGVVDEEDRDEDDRRSAARKSPTRRSSSPRKDDDNKK